MEPDRSIKTSGIIPLSKKNGEWKVFLIQHKGYEHYWGCPKGHLMPNETHEDAACRELKEETGLEVKNFIQKTPLLEEFYWMKKNKRMLKQVLFFVAEVDGEVHLQQEEIAGGQWFSFPEAIEKVIHPEGKSTLMQAEQFVRSLS